MNAHTTKRVAHLMSMTNERKGLTTTVADFCKDRVTKIKTKVTVCGSIEIDTVMHAIKKAFQKF